ncbi:uncharacterized protein METZ01_LOCUS183465 [marine metagenome]|uniref:DUF5683 domain-containing protein n=1 Tax=marine metagenome TaxID=408172 RepID=A0A382CYQ5_9ZZZZ
MKKSILIRGIVVFLLTMTANAEKSTKVVSLKMGNRLAVLEFEGQGISAPLTAYLTEEFRTTIRKLKIFEVQHVNSTDKVNIFGPKPNDYWDCWSERCAIELGKLLKVNYVIAGDIQNELDDEFLIVGRLYSIDLEMLTHEFSLESSGITDSLLLEMKKLAYDVSGLPVPDTLSVGSDISEIAALEKPIIKPKWKMEINLPPIPGKIKSLLMSTALPGSGQIWSNKRYPGYAFMSTEATIGLTALVVYLQYNRVWGGFERNYQSYQQSTDPHTLQELRPQVIQYADDSRRYNALMKNLRNVGMSIWIINMFHAYLVGPGDDFFDGDFFFDLEYDPGVNQVQAKFNFSFE